MPFIQIKPEHGLTDEVHKEIKLKAIKSNKTIPEYILDCVALNANSNLLEVKRPKNFIQNPIAKQPTPSKEEWKEINKAQEVLNDGFVANSDKIHKKSPSKKEYGYPKFRSLNKK